MQGLGVFGKACPIHKQNIVSNICTHPTCPHRVLCVKCVMDHGSGHSNNMKSILESLMIDTDTEFVGKDVQCDKILEQQIRDFDKYLNNLRKEFEKALLEIQTLFTTKLKAKYDGLKSPVTEDWDALKRNYLKKKKDCLTSQISDESIAKKLRNDFAEVYSRVINAKNVEPNKDQTIEEFKFSEKLSQEIASIVSIEILGKNIYQEKNNLAWSLYKKSSHISLPEGNKKAVNSSIDSGKFAVLGNVILDEGVQTWEVEAFIINTKREKAWTACGIVSLKNANNLENFKYENSICVAMNRWDSENQLFWDNTTQKRVFKCVLDFNKGTFTITSEGIVFLHVNKGIHGNMFYPLGIVHEPGDSLRII